MANLTKSFSDRSTEEEVIIRQHRLVEKEVAEVLQGREDVRRTKKRV